MSEIITNLSMRDYLANPGYGSSDLRAFRIGPPAMVPWGRANRDDDSTDATRLGTAAHAAILQPDIYRGHYVVKPEGMTFASNVGKAWRDQKLAAGVPLENILSFGDGAAVEAIERAFEGKQAAADALTNAALHDTVECGVLWTDPCGLPLKGKPDWFDQHAVYDLKVSAEAAKDVNVLRYRAYTNGWLAQLAHNRAGLRANGVGVKVGRLVVIAPKPPQEHRVWLLEVSEDDLDILALENENTARDMVTCHLSGVWPGTPDTWQKVTLPIDHMMADVEGAEDVEEEVPHGQG